MKFIDTDAFRAELRAKRTPDGGVFRVSAEPSISVEGKERTERFCFSDGSVDRMGDTIDPNGWDTVDFLNNPVALWAHDSSAPPIGGASNLAVEAGRLMGDIEFASADVYPFADTIYRLVRGKFLRAVSVGFIPLEYSFVEDKDRPWGIDFKRQSLLEISICPVPANPNALQEARAKGIDTRPLVEWAERALDGTDRAIVSRAELERLRKAAKEPSMKRPSPRRRGANEDDPAAGGAIVGDCGRKPDEACGMKNPDECSVHGGTRSEDPEDEKLFAALRRLFARRRDASDGDGSDEPPVAHEDAIRLAHKSLRTSKAFLTEGMLHNAKAMDLLDGVVDALNGDAGNEEGTGNREEDPGVDSKAAQLRRARELRAKHNPA